MSDESLRAWVTRWAATYPDAEAEDAFLAPFAGADHLSRVQLEALVRWKHQDDPRRRATALRRLATEPDDRISDLTGRAIGCNDDLGALLLIAQLSGVGPSLGSAILMAAVPTRYTVMDWRALASLRALGFWAWGRTRRHRRCGCRTSMAAAALGNWFSCRSGPWIGRYSGPQGHRIRPNLMLRKHGRSPLTPGSFFFVETRGVEPPTPCVQSRCSSH